jgi:hypothetical protein
MFMATIAIDYVSGSLKVGPRCRRAPPFGDISCDFTSGLAMALLCLMWFFGYFEELKCKVTRKLITPVWWQAVCFIITVVPICNYLSIWPVPVVWVV